MWQAYDVRMEHIRYVSDPRRRISTQANFVVLCSISDHRFSTIVVSNGPRTNFGEESVHEFFEAFQHFNQHMFMWTFMGCYPRQDIVGIKPLAAAKTDGILRAVSHQW